MEYPSIYLEYYVSLLNLNSYFPYFIAMAVQLLGGWPIKARGGKVFFFLKEFSQ